MSSLPKLNAKIQEAFNITFEIKACPNKFLYPVDNLFLESLPPVTLDPEGLWVWHKLKKLIMLYRIVVAVLKIKY